MRRSKRGRRRLLVAVASLAVVVGGYFIVQQVQSVQRHRNVDVARAAGLEAVERGDYRTALEKLSYVITHRKNDIDVVMSFADARAKLAGGDPKLLLESVFYHEMALRLLAEQPDHPDAEACVELSLERLMELRGQLGHQLELLAVADRLLAIDPNDKEALTARSSALIADRRFDEAMATAKHLTELEPDNIDWPKLQLQIMRIRGDRDELILETCSQWAEEWQGDGRFRLLRAAWLAEMGRFDEAVAESERAAAAGAENVDVLRQMVGLLDLLDRRDLATSVIQAAKQRFPTEQWVREGAIRRLWQIQDVQAAIAEFDQAAEAFPDLDPAMLRWKVLLAMTDNRGDDARASAIALRTHAAADAADRAWAKCIETRLDAVSGDWVDALRVYRDALATLGRDPVIHYLIGEAALRTGDQSAAVRAFRQSFELDPNWVTAGVAYSEALLAVGRPEEALAVARVVLTRTPHDRVGPYLLCARAYVAALRAGSDAASLGGPTGGRLDVISLLETIERGAPGQPAVTPLLVEALVLNARSQDAAALIQTSINRESTPAPTLLALVEVSRSYRLGAEDQLISAAAARDARPADIAFAKADSLALLGRAADGLREIDQLIASTANDSPELPSLLQRRVGYLIRTGDERAIPSMRALCDKFAQTPNVQLFVLSQKETWEDAPLVDTAIRNLKSALGEAAPQVKLAEATKLLRYHAGDKERLAAAAVMIHNVLDRSPDSLAALTLLAEAMLASGRSSHDQAIEALRKAVDLYPGQAALYPRLITLLQQKGDFETAQRYLLRMAKVGGGGDAGSIRERARLLAAQGDFEGALAAASRLVDSTSSPTEQLSLALLYQRAGRTVQAEEIYTRLLADPEAQSAVIAQAADFYAVTRRLPQALELLGRITAKPGDASSALMLGSFHLRHGNADEAGRRFHEAVSIEPDSTDAWEQLARYHLARRDVAKASEAAARGLRIRPDHEGLRLVVAMASLSAGEQGRAQAIGLLREMNLSDDSLLATLELIESVPRVDGRPTPGASELAAARSLVDKHAAFLPAWMLAISMHNEAGRVDEAISLGRRAMARFPLAPEPADWTTRLLINRHRWAEALAEADVWRERLPSDPMPADLTAATVLIELGRFSEASQRLAAYGDRFQINAAAEPDRLAVYLRTLAMSGEYSKAKTIAAPMLSTDQTWRARWGGIARGLNENDAVDALELLEAFASQTPGESLVVAAEWTALGRRLNRNDLFDRAEALIAKTSIPPEQAVIATFIRGTIAEARGDAAGAERLYQQVLERQPNDPATLNNLAHIIMAQPARLAEALDLVNRALQQQPQNPSILDTKGQILLAMGKLSEAAAELERAASIRPGDAKILLNLVQARIQQNRLDEARRTLDEVEQAQSGRSTLDAQDQQRIKEMRQELAAAQASAQT